MNMLIKNTYLFTILVFLSNSAFSQMSKANKHYNQSEFIKAIPYYKKELKKSTSPENQEALIKLADSYRLINDYTNAEKTYKQAVEIGSDLPPSVFYNYAQVLKVAQKYEAAANQYANYLQHHPNDEGARLALKFCDEINYQLAKPVEYAVKNVKSLNTAKSEFSPFVVNNKLIFVAERASFDFINYELNAYNGQPYLNMYISNLEGTELKNYKPISGKINTAQHDGPACVSSDGNLLYFTRVSAGKKQGSNNSSKICLAEYSGNTWKNIRELSLGSEGYSFGHPSIDNNNITLYFSSDMPGGYGGKDIWMCQKKGDEWSEPKNLGPEINTSGDEMFPSIRKDGVLFFSSNGLPGFGGMDIFSAINIDSKWVLQRNEGFNLNSSMDDFGITFLNDSVGYFSSNRSGGLGSDDIYSYLYKNKSLEINGTLLLTENFKDVAKDKKVVLLDEKGHPIDSMRTDSKGYFAFKNLNADKKYMATIYEDDPELTGKARYYLANKDSVIQRVSGKTGDKRFAFKNLPIDPNSMPDLYVEENLVFAGTLKAGEPPMALKYTRLKIVNEYGDVVEETTTNEFGAFAFRNIPSDQNYLVSIEESELNLPEGTKITLTNRIGKEVRTYYTGKEKFSFKVLNSDKNILSEMDAEDANLVMGIYGYMYDQDKKPIINARIRVKDEDGSNEQELITSEKGKFTFKNLNADKNYIFEADEDDPGLAGVKRIYIADSKGRIYKVVEISGGKFSFKILEADKFTLGEFVLDDPSLKITARKKIEEKIQKEKEIISKKPIEPLKEKEEPEPQITVTVVENIYYAFGEYKLDAEGQSILDRAAAVLLEEPRLIMEINSHTDSQSSSEFNMGLSSRRAQHAVDYLVGKGIAKNRLKSRGYGESRLLNHCADGVTCSDEEHRVNRRTEFKISKPAKK
jgi:outer membrane protein OmpA-like peptidoglycan-associated protein